MLQFWEGVQVKTEKLQLTADQYLAILMYVVVKARIKDLEAQMFLIEQFTDDFTLNVTKEGYMFLTVKQAVQFLKTVDEDKVSQEGYLKSLIEEKRQQMAKRQAALQQKTGNRTMVRPLSNTTDQSFNLLANPNDGHQSLVHLPKID